MTTKVAGFLPVLTAVALQTGLPAAEPPPSVAGAYVAYGFEPAEGWHLLTSRAPGITRWEGKTWSLDFSRGAASIGLSPPDRCLLGRPQRLCLRARGSAKGHPVHVFLHTHFMTFHKVVGEFTGPGEQELVVEAPPGPGWQWFGGENDGKLHGPVRLGEIRLESGGKTDRCTLELLSVTVEATCPADRRCVLVAESKTNGGQIHFAAGLRALSEVPLAGKLRWQLRSWDGKDLGQGWQAVTIPAGAEPLSVAIPPLAVPKDLRFVEAEFQLDAPGQKTPAAEAYWLAPLEAKMDNTLRPESPMGMGLYLCRLDGGDMERSARMGRDAGVKWSREDFSWSRIEPEKGRFHWDYYDRLLACAKRNGITVYAIVGYWSPWTKPYSEEGIDDYVRFLKELVKRYRGDIKQWEIWNEPNIFFWQGPKELYATLLTKSHAAVKEIDPFAQVLGLSTAGIDFRFIDDMLARKAPFDILTIHPYRRVLDDQGFINDLKRVSDVVKLPDGRRRPVWLTEMGWATHVPHNALGQDFQPNTQRAQAELIARSYLCSVVSGVEPRTFWYDFRNDGDDPLYFEHNMGIVTRDFRPKPAYVAYATLARMLLNRKLAGPVAAPEGTLVYRFVPEKPENGGGSVVAGWNPKQDVEIRLPVRAARVVRVNAVGESLPLETETATSPSEPLVRVGLKQGVPVYIVEGDVRILQRLP